MPRAKKETPRYYVHNDSCDNFDGPYKDLKVAKAAAQDSLNNYGRDDEDNEVQVLLAVGTLTPPQSTEAIWKDL